MLADPHRVSGLIAGVQEGDAFLRSIDTCSDPEVLARKLLELAAMPDVGNARFFGFVRALQKRLESAARREGR